MGYAGIFMDIAEYAMSDPNPFVPPPNPGATPNFDLRDEAGQPRFLNDNDRAQIKAAHAADIIRWTNVDVVNRVIRDAVDKAVPKIYKPSSVVGQMGFGSKTIREIFQDLYARYGQVTPNDIKNLTFNLYKDWNPASPIENFFLNIETQQVFATRAARPFQTYQLVEAALAVIRASR
jgi:hypothetical protein